MRSVFEIQQSLKAINRWHKNKEMEKPGKDLYVEPLKSHQLMIPIWNINCGTSSLI